MLRLSRLFVLLAAVVFIAGTALARQNPIAFEDHDTLEEIREKIRINGYQFTVDNTRIFDLPMQAKARLLTRRAGSAEEDVQAPSRLPPLAQILPSSFDWRNKDGHAYIGPVKDQGDCGACYAFGAVAAAEGTYNYAMGLHDAERVEFSESFIAWCLGKYGPYAESFSGCDGADYSYSELKALTREGITSAADFPYTDSDPGSCTHWDAPRTVFRSWGRCGCNSIDQIKTAIMTHGVVEAAVNTTSAFLAYSGGIYEDTQTDCPESPCHYTETDHAVALVGWDDNGDPMNRGYWILRNSWGDDWGEHGYMRIRYTSARVGCVAAYLSLQGGAAVPTGPLQLLLLGN